MRVRILLPQFCAIVLSLSLVNAGFGDFLNKTKEIAQVAKDTGEALAKKAPELIPSADDLLDFSKQTLAGLPFEAGVALINKICMYLLFY